MTRTTEELLKDAEEVEELDKKRTRGEWGAFKGGHQISLRDGGVRQVHRINNNGTRGLILLIVQPEPGAEKADSNHAFIAHAPKMAALIAELSAKLRESEKNITHAELDGLLNFIDNLAVMDIDCWTNIAEYCSENGLPYKGTNDSQEGFKEGDIIMRTTEEVLKDAEFLAAYHEERGGLIDNIKPGRAGVAEGVNAMVQLIAELSAKLRGREEVLDHIHHVAAGACDSDKDKTLLSIISEASKPTPPNKED